jgi:hypothetical protein
MKYIFLIVISILISGCVGPYYGYTKSEWESFDEVRRQEAINDYKQLMNSKDSLTRGNKADEATDAFIERSIDGEG